MDHFQFSWNWMVQMLLSCHCRSWIQICLSVSWFYSDDFDDTYIKMKRDFFLVLNELNKDEIVRRFLSGVWTNSVSISSSLLNWIKLWLKLNGSKYIWNNDLSQSKIKEIKKSNYDIIY